MQEILAVYLAVSHLYDARGEIVGLAMLIDTANNCVPGAIAALSLVPETSDAVAVRKIALRRSWSQYSRSLQLDDEALVIGSQAYLVGVPAWSTCAAKSCPCYRKKPCHRLRVCKGCWQTYYCGVRCQKM